MPCLANLPCAADRNQGKHVFPFVQPFPCRNPGLRAWVRHVFPRRRPFPCFTLSPSAHSGTRSSTRTAFFVDEKGVREEMKGGEGYSRAARAAICAGVVAQLVAKRVTARPSGRRSQTSKATWGRSCAIRASVRMGNCWLVGESMAKG